MDGELESAIPQASPSPDVLATDHALAERNPPQRDGMLAPSVDVIPDGLEQAHRIWSRDEAIHRTLSAGEQACGLSGDPLDHNTTHDPEVTREKIDCLARIESSRTSWRAFLFSVDLSRSRANSCAALELAGTAMSESPRASVSSFGLMPADSANPLLPFAAKYRLLKFPVAASAYFDANTGLGKSFLATIRECPGLDRERTALQKREIVEFYEGMSGDD